MTSTLVFFSYFLKQNFSFSIFGAIFVPHLRHICSTLAPHWTGHSLFGYQEAILMASTLSSLLFDFSVQISYFAQFEPHLRHAYPTHVPRLRQFYATHTPRHTPCLTRLVISLIELSRQPLPMASSTLPGLFFYFSGKIFHFPRFAPRLRHVCATLAPYWMGDISAG